MTSGCESSHSRQTPPHLPQSLQQQSLQQQQQQQQSRGHPPPLQQLTRPPQLPQVSSLASELSQATSAALSQEQAQGQVNGQVRLQHRQSDGTPPPGNLQQSVSLQSAVPPASQAAMHAAHVQQHHVQQQQQRQLQQVRQQQAAAGDFGATLGSPARLGTSPGVTGSAAIPVPAYQRTDNHSMQSSHGYDGTLVSSGPSSAGGAAPITAAASARTFDGSAAAAAAAAAGERVAASQAALAAAISQGFATGLFAPHQPVGHDGGKRELLSQSSASAGHLSPPPIPRRASISVADEYRAAVRGAVGAEAVDGSAFFHTNTGMGGSASYGSVLLGGGARPPRLHHPSPLCCLHVLYRSSGSVL